MERWRHKTCGGIVVFDLSGGFCTQCHAENLEAPGDVAPEMADEILRADTED